MKYVPHNAAQINKVQRKALLRSICAYSSVSETVTNILSGVPLADLLARERNTIFTVRKSGQHTEPSPRMETMRRWKKRIDESSTGNWTRSLVNNVDAWCLRKHGNLDFFTTQMLSGHSCFGKYL